MPRLDETQRAALGYWWNLVSDAARSGFTTTETISIANDIARQFGEKITPAENRAIATLYGYAKRIDNAAKVFQNLSPTERVTLESVATAPYARDEREQSSYPLYHVQFYYTYIDQAGNEQIGIRTSIVSMNLPDTAQGVRDIVEIDAQAMSSKYGHQFVSAIPFSILAV